MSARLINRGERLTAIERVLFRSGKGLRAVEIAESCGVDRRTIYRDLETLQKLGIPVTQEEGRFFLNRDYYRGRTGKVFDALTFKRRLGVN